MQTALLNLMTSNSRQYPDGQSTETERYRQTSWNL